MKENFINAEPLLSNRYIVKMSDFFKINDYMIQEVKLPKFKNSFFGGNWTDLEITCFNFKGEFLKSIHDNRNAKDFIIRIDQIDPTGLVIFSWKIICAKINEIEYSTLAYTDDSIHKTFIKFDVKAVCTEDYM